MTGKLGLGRHHELDAVVVREDCELGPDIHGGYTQVESWTSSPDAQENPAGTAHLVSV
jgi:hypothetical protein